MLKSRPMLLCLGSLPLGAVLSACSVLRFPIATEAPVESQPPVPAPIVLFLTEKDANRTHKISVGEGVEVRLVSNPSTGFEWVVPQVNPALPVEGKTEFVAPDTDRAGAPGVQIWRFKAAKSAKVSLELHYLRSWEKVAPAKVWKADFEIK